MAFRDTTVVYLYGKKIRVPPNQHGHRYFSDRHQAQETERVYISRPLDWKGKSVFYRLFAVGSLGGDGEVLLCAEVRYKDGHSFPVDVPAEDFENIGKIREEYLQGLDDDKPLGVGPLKA